MERGARHAVAEVRLGQHRGQPAGDLTLDHGLRDQLAHPGGHLGQSRPGRDPGGLQRSVSADGPLRGVPVAERRGGHQHIREVTATVEVRSAAQRPDQGHVRAGLQHGGGGDGYAAVGQGPAGAVPAGVLDPEVEHGRVCDRPLGWWPVELLRPNPAGNDLVALHPHPFPAPDGHDHIEAPTADSSRRVTAGWRRGRAAKTILRCC